MALTIKNENASSIAYNKNEIKSSGVCRSYKNIKSKGLKGNINKRVKTNNSIYTKRNPKYTNKNIKKIKKELMDLI